MHSSCRPSTERPGDNQAQVDPRESTVVSCAGSRLRKATGVECRLTPTIVTQKETRTVLLRIQLGRAPRRMLPAHQSPGRINDVHPEQRRIRHIEPQHTLY